MSSFMSEHPVIIQGGMGAGVSNWRLANAVSSLGQLGVVSGTALDAILVRRLQDGDVGGHIRRALDSFPDRALADRIFRDYYLAGGRASKQPYVRLPMYAKDAPRPVVELVIVANYVEVFLAQEGHANPVGINYLEKIQLPLLPCLYGAMLAGVGYVLIGAGIPLKVPGVIDAFVEHSPATYPLYVAGSVAGDDFTMTFDPREYLPNDLPPLRRPYFLPIVSSNTLATTLVKKANGRVDGFIVEGSTAGGHNAPPRGALQLDAHGEPIYGDRDRVNLAELNKHQRPVWLAGGYGRPGRLKEALAAGAAGIQVGTAFALCDESGLRDDYKRELLAKAKTGEACIFTDPVASPTGFPFKVAQLAETAADPDVYEARPRICDLGYLRQLSRGDDGKIVYRCPAEPVPVYLAKGGDLDQTVGRKCLCNGLMANIGHPQLRNGSGAEPGLVTAGDDVAAAAQFLPAGQSSYRAADVIASLLKS
jgi:nitronate monooxygenase